MGITLPVPMTSNKYFTSSDISTFETLTGVYGAEICNKTANSIEIKSNVSGSSLETAWEIKGQAAN
jgi:hypothetical protein